MKKIFLIFFIALMSCGSKSIANEQSKNTDNSSIKQDTLNQVLLPDNNIETEYIFLSGHVNGRAANLFLVKDRGVPDMYVFGYLYFIDNEEPILLKGGVSAIGTNGLAHIISQADDEGKYKDKGDLVIDLQGFTSDDISYKGIFENGIFEGEIIKQTRIGERVDDSNKPNSKFEFKYVQNPKINLKHIVCDFDKNKGANNFVIPQNITLNSPLIKELNKSLFNTTDGNFDNICKYSKEKLLNENDSVRFSVRMIPIFINDKYFNILIWKRHEGKRDGVIEAFVEKRTIAYSLTENKKFKIKDFISGDYRNILKEEILKEILKERTKEELAAIRKGYEELVLKTIDRDNIFVTSKGIGFVMSEETIYGEEGDVFISFKRINELFKK